jgi:hypothetical protein
MKRNPAIRRHVRAMIDALDRASAAIADAQRARAALARAGTVELRVVQAGEPEGGTHAEDIADAASRR